MHTGSVQNAATPNAHTPEKMDFKETQPVSIQTRISGEVNISES
jgi:hypothetical protein